VLRLALRRVCALQAGKHLLRLALLSWVSSSAELYVVCRTRAARPRVFASVGVQLTLAISAWVRHHAVVSAATQASSVERQGSVKASALILLVLQPDQRRMPSPLLPDLICQNNIETSRLTKTSLSRRADVFPLAIRHYIRRRFSSSLLKVRVSVLYNGMTSIVDECIRLVSRPVRSMSIIWLVSTCEMPC
jgi:hypothetical protein